MMTFVSKRQISGNAPTRLAAHVHVPEGGTRFAIVPYARCNVYLSAVERWEDGKLIDVMPRWARAQKPQHCFQIHEDHL